MSKEARNLTFTFTVKDYEDLPEKNGEQMYADDVVDELYTVLQAAADTWYATRGHQLIWGMII